MNEEQVYSTRTIRRRLLGLAVERPQAPPGRMLILSGGTSDIVLLPGQRPTLGEAVWNRYTQVTEIDTSRRDLKFQAPARARGGDVSFTVNFEAAYLVTNPIAMINSGFRDAEEALRRVLKEAITRVTEQYEIEDVPGATAAVRKMLDEGKYVKDLPFSLSTVHVTLDLDAAAKRHLEVKREQKRAAELAKSSIDKIKAEGEAQAAVVDATAGVERKKAQHDSEREVERRKLYTTILEQGMMGMLIEQLVQRPGDINQVVGMMATASERRRADDIRALEVLLQGDFMDEAKVAPVARDLLARLRGGFQSSLTDQFFATPRQIGETAHATTEPEEP